jgi:predicted regulator of Ras-like GTPase activity (Roadblock/LC7/MglB family)
MRSIAMEKPLDFEKLSSIAGVKSYYVVKHDGSLVAAKGDAATEIPQFLALAGLNGEAICSLLGHTQFNHMILSRQGKESILIFPLEDQFLAIMKEPHATTADLNPIIRGLIDGRKT